MFMGETGEIINTLCRVWQTQAEVKIGVAGGPRLLLSHILECLVLESETLEAAAQHNFDNFLEDKRRSI